MKFFKRQIAGRELNNMVKSLRCFRADPEVQLMIRTQDGDHSAFDELFQGYRKHVHHSLLKMIGDWYEAEDLTQESFLRVYRSRHHYRPTARFRTWLDRIVTNVGRNALRSRSRCRNLMTNSDWEISHPDNHLETSLQIILRSESQRQVRAALADLPDAQRWALTWQTDAGCSIREISDKLQIPHSTAKSILSRGRKAIRRNMAAVGWDWSE